MQQVSRWSRLAAQAASNRTQPRKICCHSNHLNNRKREGRRYRCVRTITSRALRIGTSRIADWSSAKVMGWRRQGYPLLPICLDSFSIVESIFGSYILPIRIRLHDFYRLEVWVIQKVGWGFWYCSIIAFSFVWNESNRLLRNGLFDGSALQVSW